MLYLCVLCCMSEGFVNVVTSCCYESGLCLIDAIRELIYRY